VQSCLFVSHPYSLPLCHNPLLFSLLLHPLPSSRYFSLPLIISEDFGFGIWLIEFNLGISMGGRSNEKDELLAQ